MGGKPAQDPNIMMGTPMLPPPQQPFAGGQPPAAGAQGGNDLDDLQARMDALKNL